MPIARLIANISIDQWYDSRDFSFTAAVCLVGIICYLLNNLTVNLHIRML